ncbi:MAG: hypothetical protein RQ966_15125 [Acetobacteraceae bacterium]|nr:hypothetical protein [Acetobacteraceae bacterium]
MTADRFRDILDELHWSLRALAEMIGGDERNVRRWARGRLSVPEPVAEWLEIRLAAHRAHPPPRDWRRRQAA